MTIQNHECEREGENLWELLPGEEAVLVEMVKLDLKG